MSENYYDSDNYYDGNEYKTTSTTAELSRTEYGTPQKIDKDIRVTKLYHYIMIPIKKLDFIVYMFEIKRKFLFIPYWIVIGKYYNYDEGHHRSIEKLRCS